MNPATSKSTSTRMPARRNRTWAKEKKTVDNRFVDSPPMDVGKRGEKQIHLKMSKEAEKKKKLRKSKNLIQMPSDEINESVARGQIIYR